MTSELSAGCYLCDYHVHTDLSFDGRGTLSDFCLAAIDHGIKELGFSEHVGIDASDDAYGTLDYERYRRGIESVRERYAGKLIVKMGVEVDFRSGVIAGIEHYIQTHEFDYVIGAVHYLEGDILLRTAIFEERPQREVWDDYFNEMFLMAQTGLFDIIAHLDVPKRGYVPLYGPFDWTLYEDAIGKVLAEAITRDTALEINTAGLRKQADEIFPSLGVLKLYHQLGGKLVTFGSDAHSPGKVGCDFGAALEAADAAGLTEVSTYSGRKRTTVPIRI